MKYCPKCCQEKAPEEFHKHSKRYDGLQARCKPCNSQATKDAHKANPQHSRAKHIRNAYGLDWETYEEMFKSQDGSCYLCQHPLKLYSNDLMESARVDHDHETGQVRALLCHNCNALLGHGKENPMLLRKAADYLEYFKHHKGK